jgi:hypothetical protein
LNSSFSRLADLESRDYGNFGKPAQGRS